jgi:hypothetical protein
MSWGDGERLSKKKGLRTEDTNDSATILSQIPNMGISFLYWE